MFSIKFEAEVDDPLNIAIVTNPRMYLTPERAKVVQENISWCILNRFLKSYNAVPGFEDNPTVKDGVLYSKCSDNSSLMLLRQYFSDSDEIKYNRVRFNTQTYYYIEFKLKEEIPKLVKCFIKLSSLPISEPEFRKVLNAQNGKYNVHEWFYYDCKQEGTATFPLVIFTYYIPEEIVTKLQEANYKLSFGFGCIILDVNREE